MNPETVIVKVQRGAAGATGATGAAGANLRLEKFEVPYRAGMSALDALMWIRAHVDSSLAIRYSCINANACKECMMRIDGRTQYACTARLGPQGATIEPLPNKRLIRDLVTDIVPPKERLENLLDRETG
jgi:succinate dehydrogenase/fumarate reductase-like Fe-S protein